MKETIDQMLVRHEGLRLKPYKDTVGKLTIGVGRNLEDKGITVHEAMVMLGVDLRDAERDAVRWLGEDTFQFLSEARKMVVLNMAFNLGYDRLKGFRKLRIALLDRDYIAASAEMLDSKWASQVGPRALELSEIMRTGQQQI